MAASAVSGQWLKWVEQLGREETRPRGLRSDPDRFACILERQPGLLVPRRFVGSTSVNHDAEFATDQGELALNAGCILCPPGEVPAQLGRTDEWRDGFVPCAYSTAWIHDPDRRQWRPFWLGEDFAERIFAIQTSGMRASAFDASEVALLLSAGILTTTARVQTGRDDWNEACSRSQERFRDRGYCAVNGLIHSFHVGELRRYYRRLIRHGRVALGDYQSSRRYVAHNEPVERFFHLQLTEAVSQLVGEPVMPSYVYLASYLGGARLPRHTDREQCEFSVTFCLDYAPDPLNETPWPLHLEIGRSRVTVRQALGDALIYRGCQLPHYRDPLPEGHLSTSIFFHYVRPDFTGSLS